MATPKITRTPEQQRERTYEGNEIQKIVKMDLERYMSEINVTKKIRVYPSEGIDIRLKNGKTITIEVKSARQWEHTVKGRIHGRFWIKPDDFKAEYFAFVVKDVDEQFLWDRSKPVQIHYVETKSLIDYLKSKFKAEFEKKRLNFKLSITEMLNLPRVEKISMENVKNTMPMNMTGNPVMIFKDQNLQLCNDIMLVYKESKSEMITQHNVIGKLQSLKKKKEKTDKDKKTINEYERIERAWLSIGNAKSKYCDGKEVNVSHEDLKLLEIVWKDEITKYHVGFLPKYKKLVLAIERITSTI